MKRVLKEKQKMITKWGQRSDYNGILQVVSSAHLTMNQPSSSTEPLMKDRTLAEDKREKLYL